MANSPGFGKPKPAKQPSKSAEKRSTASKQYDQMQGAGLPEFNVFIRVKDNKTWFPVGSIAVNRSNQISRAIFEKEADLLQGAFRLFPVLRKNQSQLEYGYRLKQYPDEPIQLAVRPAPGSGNPIQAIVSQVGDRLSGLWRRSSK